MKILGFGHQSRVGKTLCGELLREWAETDGRGHAMPVHVRSFAAHLKAVCHDLFGAYGMKPGPHYEAHPEDREIALPIGKTPVQVWIDVGQHMRAVHPNVWRDHVFTNAPPSGLLVITDVRFPNEANEIKRLGGWVVKVTRPDAPPPKGSDREFSDYYPWNAEIHNDGTVDELRAKVYALAERYLRLTA